ncbi:MAG: IS66 family insertion sequence element accessory protein TnpB [Terracidiphilus sp.]
MLRLPNLGELDHAATVRIFLCTQTTDMRRSFDRLAEMVKEAMSQDPLSGNLFVFRSRGADKLKILYWDRDGLAIWYKRLEEGVFRFPRIADGQASVEVKGSELAMLLEGIDLRSVKRTPRFVRTQKILQKS